MGEITTESLKGRITAAITLATQYGGFPGEQKKAWIIDQMVRVLAADKYDEIVAAARAGESGPEDYDWDVGIAP